MLLPFARDVPSAVKRNDREFGATMTMDELAAKFVRVETQPAPLCGSFSIDRHAARDFQAYVAAATRFSVARAGLLYGTVDGETHDVRVEAIYEPPQDATPAGVTLTRGDDEAVADFVAGELGLVKASGRRGGVRGGKRARRRAPSTRPLSPPQVGWVLAQSAAPRDYILSDVEVRQAAALHTEVGPHAVTAVVSTAPPDADAPPGALGDVHFEAFQVSAQCARLAAGGWLAPPAAGSPAGTTAIVNPADPLLALPAIVGGKDAKEVDNDYFLVPVPIRDHGGPLGRARGFAVENRLTPQGPAQLAAFLADSKSGPRETRYADFHLLLWLAKQPQLGPDDVSAIARTVAAGEPVGEGYDLILESLAAG